MKSRNSEVRTIINRFLNRWCKENKEKIARLKLTGSLEDYLVKELAYQFLDQEGKFRVYLNMGPERRKIDMCIISKTSQKDTYRIRALIEAKYLSNAHWDIKDSAQSGWKKGTGGFNYCSGRKCYKEKIKKECKYLGKCNSLKKQLEEIQGYKQKEFCLIQRKLRHLNFVEEPKAPEVYGLVFVGAIVGNGKDEGFIESISGVVKDNFKVGLERIFEVDHVGFYGAVCEKK